MVLLKTVNTSLESIRFWFASKRIHPSKRDDDVTFWLGCHHTSSTLGRSQTENENEYITMHTELILEFKFTKKHNIILKRRYNSIWFTLNNHPHSIRLLVRCFISRFSRSLRCSRFAAFFSLSLVSFHFKRSTLTARRALIVVALQPH